ncbi:hypothetical protein CEXT_203391 [Caerostris extrusa]|uniref:Uncharacterized protein n=1 Tax=Caerostris extrusa TaxID=172846 RepID=A0AAV4R559_CAEEX|nr:hypothetical protein CEXT_203391 [Caerostris extrusa]
MHERLDEYGKDNELRKVSTFETDSESRSSNFVKFNDAVEKWAKSRKLKKDHICYWKGIRHTKFYREMTNRRTLMLMPIMKWYLLILKILGYLKSAKTIAKFSGMGLLYLIVLNNENCRVFHNIRNSVPADYASEQSCQICNKNCSDKACISILPVTENILDTHNCSSSGCVKKTNERTRSKDFTEDIIFCIEVFAALNILTFLFAFIYGCIRRNVKVIEVDIEKAGKYTEEKGKKTAEVMCAIYKTGDNKAFLLNDNNSVKSFKKQNKATLDTIRKSRIKAKNADNSSGKPLPSMNQSETTESDSSLIDLNSPQIRKPKNRENYRISNGFSHIRNKLPPSHHSNISNDKLLKCLDQSESSENNLSINTSNVEYSTEELRNNITEKQNLNKI